MAYGQNAHSCDPLISFLGLYNVTTQALQIEAFDSFDTIYIYSSNTIDGYLT